MASRATGVRLSPELEKEIAREAEIRGKSRSAVTQDLLSEAVRMRRTPGIVFADGPSGRRAVVAGTGLDVWEVVRAWREGDRAFGELCREYSWLAEPQLRAAIAYYELYPEEIDARLAREERWTSESLRREHPALVPRGSRR